MDIETSGAIKLFFPNPSLRLVYFEAIANSLDAGATEVSVKIKIDSYDKPETLEIEIIDNGDGFNDENFERFRTLLKPRDKFHKGIGRLVFLNYFKCVDISSFWGFEKREFRFKEGFNENVPSQSLDIEVGNETCLVFSGFVKGRVKSYSDLKPEIIKESLIEHFLPTFYALKKDGRDFRILIDLKTEEENRQKEFFATSTEVTVDDLPEMEKVEIRDVELDAFSGIDMHYHISSVPGKGSSVVAFDIDGRTIPANIISSSSMPIGYRYVFIFESELFHSHADSSRQKLILPEGVKEASLYRVLRRELGKVLVENIPEITRKNDKTKEEFEESFPHLLGYFDNDVVGLIDQEDALASAQQNFFQAQKEVLQCERLSDRLYEKSLELSSRALTEYVLYREKIISRMREMTAKDSESDIHNLIVPRYKEFSDGSMVSEIYQNNAWLLDDKFMVFRTILSEKRMDTVINAIRLDEERVGDDGRPDIAMVFSADPEDVSKVDVVVVEIKKKTDDEKENQYAINQLLDRAVKLVEFCPEVQRIWYYAVMQVNKTMATRLRQQKWAPLFSKGEVFYQEYETPHPDGGVVPTPTFVMSFDAIVADAEWRNHTFLEILRSGMRKYAEA